jgi:diguanylate cyclase (GGDEF)-like protein
MNIYALIPLIATIAYIPLLVTTASARPWSKQHRLFFAFLCAAFLYSLVDIFFRSNLMPGNDDYNKLLLKIIIFLFALMAVQFHCFTSYFFPADKSRWLPVAYISLIVTVIPLIWDKLPVNVETTPGEIGLHANYGPYIVCVAIPLIVLLARNLFIFVPRLKNQDNPVTYNQMLSIVICLSVLTFFMAMTVFPIGAAFPIGHAGNLSIAIILSYAAVRHQLVDIRFVLRRGLIGLLVFLVGLACYVLLLLLFHTILSIDITLNMMIASSLAAIAAVIVVYKLRDIITRFAGKTFQGESYQYREKLVDFANKIHNVFNLQDQGAELLSLVTHAVDCRKAGLLFIDTSEDYVVQLVEPPDKDSALNRMRLRKDNPIVEYLKREKRPLTRENLAIQPEFMGLWQQEKDIIEINEIELFMPLISRDRLIGVLVLDKKKSGRYILEDFGLLQDVTRRVSVSMEKEYLRERLKEREEELSVINRSNAIITSSLDIQRIYDNFIKELKRVVDVDWAAIAVIEEEEIYFMALSSDIGSPWKAGERIPLKGTATEWVSMHHRPIIDSDLSVETRFVTGKYHLQHGIRSIAYMPLVISNQVIGTLAVASRKPDAYGSRHMKLLEQLAAQIAMPIENARLYAKTERMARVDSLTSLLNRRSMDEILPSEVGRHSRYGGVFSMIILDLDSFKSLNDNYGHLAGDELLRQIGIIMKNTIREADQAFRYGGDEFAILLPQTSLEAAFKVAERIRQQVYARIEIGSSPISISLGIASWPADGVGINDVMAAADVALYQSKRSGGNRTTCSTVNLNPTLTGKSTAMVTQDSGALSTIFALAATVDTRDRLTHNHSKQVHDFAVAIGEGLGLDPLEINRLGTCALLHDIGKIGISDEILHKQEKLTDKEWEVIKSHPGLGASIVSHSIQLAPCIQGILHHHEKYNGQGYPDGLKGEEIPLESRILTVADSFAAMTSSRIYSKTLTYEAGIEELKRESGKQFDPRIVEVFLKILPKAIPASNAVDMGVQKK